MSDEFVSRDEFEQFKAEVKAEVKEIKAEVTESSKLLQKIDAKIDVINEKIVTTDKMEELKLAPLEKRVTNLEESRKWYKNTIIGAIITVVIGAIVFVIKQM